MCMRIPPVFLLSLGLCVPTAFAAPPARSPTPPASSSSAASIEREIDLSAELSPFQACFVLFDPRENVLTRFNPKRCATRFSPASTFKVPNSLIGLETDVLADAEHTIRWDGTVHARAELNRDHTLRTAMRDSALWYYQDVARQIGLANMRAWLRRLGYGSMTTGDAVDRFWLDGTLTISADEQVAWLDRLRRGDLPVSSRSRDILLDVMTVIAEGDTKLFGKTGTVGKGDAAVLGWFVGFVRRDGREHVFALNIASEEGALGPTARERAKKILAKLGVLPAE